MNMIYIYSVLQAVAETAFIFLRYRTSSQCLTFPQIYPEYHELGITLNAKERTTQVGNLQGSGAQPSQTPHRYKWKHSANLLPESGRRWSGAWWGLYMYIENFVSLQRWAWVLTLKLHGNVRGEGFKDSYVGWFDLCQYCAKK